MVTVSTNKTGWDEFSSFHGLYLMLSLNRKGSEKPIAQWVWCIRVVYEQYHEHISFLHHTLTLGAMEGDWDVITKLIISISKSQQGQVFEISRTWSVLLIWNQESQNTASFLMGKNLQVSKNTSRLTWNLIFLRFLNESVDLNIFWLE